MTFVFAEAPKTDPAAVLYTADDGTRVLRRGGTRTWRNNNPGNIRSSRFTRHQGAIGAAGGFAVFPSAATGQAAVVALLQTPKYSPLSIADAIARYAPPVENDTQGYQRLIRRLTGLDIERRLSDLNPRELELVVSALQTIEGFSMGTEQVVKQVVSTVSVDGRLTAFYVRGQPNPLTLAEAVAQATAGELDAVVVRNSAGKIHLRSRPDAADVNNFDSLSRVGQAS